MTMENGMAEDKSPPATEMDDKHEVHAHTTHTVSPRRPVRQPKHSSQQKRSRRRRQDHPLYFPIWSLALMLLCVTITSFGVVMSVIGLGGQATPEDAPILVIVYSPVPSTQSVGTPPTQTRLENNPVVVNRPVVTFALNGPTLLPVPITPTPRRIAIGEQVIVVDVGATQLNVRDTAGVRSTTVLFRAPEGMIFTVIDGPQQVDGLVWWKIEDPNNPSHIGWAAANYLTVAPGS